MTIGTSIVLIAIGAILKWAVTAHVSGIDLQTAGTVLFVVGIVGLILAVAYTFWWANRTRTVGRPRRARPAALLAGCAPGASASSPRLALRPSSPRPPAPPPSRARAGMHLVTNSPVAARFAQNEG